MKTRNVTVYNGCWYGSKVSAYGLEHGYIDYACLAGTMDCVLCNDIIPKTMEYCDTWEQISGYREDPEDPEEMYTPDIYQYYIVSEMGADTLQLMNEIVFYNDYLNMYVWGVTHFGTAWDIVLTDIKIGKQVKA